MEQYLYNLVQDNNRVILPNFGAFIISKENGLTILFNNFLSFNDGLLVDYIAEKEGCDKIAATDKVDAFVEKLKTSLDEKGEYVLAGLGVFVKDDSGNIKFEQASNFGEGIPVTPVVDSDNMPKQDLLDIDSTNNATISQEVSKEVSKTEIEKAKAKVSSESLLEVAEDKPKANIAKEEKKIPSSPVQKTVKPTSQVEKKSQSGNSSNKNLLIGIVSAVILILFFAVGAYFFFFSGDDNKKPVENVKKEKIEKQESVVTPVQNNDSIDTAEINVVKKEVKPEPVKEEPIEESGSMVMPYHAVVGGFEVYENAENFKAQMEAKGYSDCRMIQYGKLTLVSVESFDNFSAAVKRQSELVEELQMDCWILTKRQ